LVIFWPGRLRTSWRPSGPIRFLPRAQSLDASLSSGFPIRIVLRSILPGSHNLLLCMEEGSIVQRADAKWRQLDAELRSVLDSVQVGVVLVDPSGRIRFSNARFGQLFGLVARQLGESANFEELEELIGKRFHDPGAFLAPWKSYAAGAGEPRHDELELTRPVKRVIERFSRPVLDSEGRSIGWSEPYSDVTSERQIQSKLLQAEKMAALGQLVSGIARELNNPLTAITGYAQLLLEVSGDGPGIPPVIASRIFDPFFITKPPGVGTGLGLSIVYGIVQQHGGEVAFENQPRAGVKFLVELPVLAVPAADRGAAHSHLADRPGSVSAGRILVVEDEPTVAQLIVDVLKEEGHHAEAVLDSQEGLTLLSRSRYDLVICDVRMPRLDGPAFHDALVRTGSPIRDKILFTTGDMLAPRTSSFSSRMACPISPSLSLWRN